MDYRKTLDRLLEEQVSTGEMAGVSALVLRGGRELYEAYYGYADREKGLPMARDTIIRLFSMTKPITAVAAMILAERGQLGMYDPVSRYLPEFRSPKVLQENGLLKAASREITVWDLLSMTSGIPYPEYWEGCTRAGLRMEDRIRPVIRAIDAGEAVSTREFVRQLSEVPLAFDPGERWMYGFSADVLGAVIEEAAGVSFGEFLKKEIFERLQMPDTGFTVSEEKKARFAMSYDPAGEGKLAPAVSSNLGECYEVREHAGFESGGAGLVSTLDDYAHFAQMLVSGGTYAGQRILGERTVSFMTKNHLRPEQMGGLDWGNNRGFGYNCLMRILIDQGKSGTNAPLGEFGWDGWTGNHVSMDPESGTVFLFFTQKRGVVTEELIRKLRFALYGGV